MLAKVDYKWGTRYWCFNDGFVVDVYDECGGVITHNPMLAKGFDDMDIDELKMACKDKYTLTLYTGAAAREILARL